MKGVLLLSKCEYTKKKLAAMTEHKRAFVEKNRTNPN